MRRWAGAGGDSAGLVGQGWAGRRSQAIGGPDVPPPVHTNTPKMKTTFGSTAGGEEEVCLLGMELGLVTDLNSRFSRERT